MKVTAKCNVNYGGEWKRSGDVFEVSDHDYNVVKNYVIVEDEKSDQAIEDEMPTEFVSEVFPPDTNQQKPVKRTRRKKTQE